MKSSTRTISSAVIALLSATALALSAAVPASALASPQGGTQNCVGTPYTPKMTVVSNNGGNWYSEDRVPAGSWAHLAFQNGGSRVWFGVAQLVEWKAASNLSVTTFSSAGAVCA